MSLITLCPIIPCSYVARRCLIEGHEHSRLLDAPLAERQIFEGQKETTIGGI